MATYSTNTYKLVFPDTPSAVEVRAISNNALEETFEIESEPLQISVSNGDYSLTRNGCTGCYPEIFNFSEGDTFQFVARSGIGIIDLRIERAQTTYKYFLDVCPVTLSYSDGEVTVKSPCTGNNCSEPNSGCRTIS